GQQLKRFRFAILDRDLVDDIVLEVSRHRQRASLDQKQQQKLDKIDKLDHRYEAAIQHVSGLTASIDHRTDHRVVLSLAPVSIEMVVGTRVHRLVQAVEHERGDERQYGNDQFVECQNEWCHRRANHTESHCGPRSGGFWSMMVDCLGSGIAMLVFVERFYSKIKFKVFFH